MADLNARVFVLESEVEGVKVGDQRRDADLVALRRDLSALETKFEVLKERVALYAAGGAVVGSVAINFVIDAIQSYLRH